MRRKLRLEDAGNQAVPHSPPPGTEIKVAIDLSRTKWVYCVRWGGQEQRRLTTPAALTHLQALVAQYPGCPVHLAFEACGFGYEIAWWAQAQAIAVTVIAPSRMERTPGLQVKTDRLDAGRMVRKLMTASFSRNSDGSKQIARVPSRHGRCRRSKTVPSGVHSSAPCATGGRKMYLHKCSSRSFSPARTAAVACTSKPSMWAWRGPPVVTGGAVGSLESSPFTVVGRGTGE
jgi:hypothetical protein